MGVSELLVVTALTVVACLLVGGLGALLLHRTRGSSLRYQLLIACLLPVVAVSATVLVNVGLMFISGHDSTVVLIALTLSTVLAAAGSWLVTRRVLAGLEHLARGVDWLVADSRPATVPAQPAPATESRGESDYPAELQSALGELTAARRAIADSRARERAAEQSRRELVTFMSHDLRTPLAGLRALSEGLEDGVIDDVPRALSHLRGTVSRMSLLVDDLFALSRVQGGSATKERRQVSLAEVIDDIAAEATATAEAAGVRLDVDVPNEDQLPVLGNHADLSRAFANLVANAIRHTNPGGMITLSARRAADGVVQVAVADQCGGIPEDHLRRVFDTGWRGSPERGSEDGGAGLGLAIAKGVVQTHEGQISVHNTGDGCRFTVQLPAVVVRR